MDDLAADLMLLAARPDGRLDVPPKLRFGLSGSELIRLTAAHRVDLEGDRIVVLDTAPTGDPLLDEALSLMTGSEHPPTAKAYVARARPRLVQRYLARLKDDGIVQADRRRVLGCIPVTRWVIVDTARASRARATLQAVAQGTVTVEPAQAALAGLASAIGLARYVFPGVAGVPARQRLKEAATRDPATDTAVRAATDAAVMAAINAATTAATSAAISTGGFH
jgi:hypothetical protein